MNGNPLFTPPLRTRGRDIVDAHNKRLKLASINWYGGSDELFVPGGLDVRPRRAIAALIRRLGFNSVRLPYSDEMVAKNPPIPHELLAANPDLFGMRALDVFEAVVTALTDEGVAVIVNDHITNAAWCDGMNLCDSSWKNDQLGPLCRFRQTEDDWIAHWETIMARFVNNPHVVGADLRNEPRGLWGTMTWTAWATAAARCGERLLKMQPNWLMIIEGVSSANDLSGVRQQPVRYSVPDRTVYSAHVYSWSGWGSLDPYKGRKYTSFVRAMEQNWAFILAENIAPVWIGEFGAPDSPNKGDAHYWKNLMKYLEEVDADFGYWAINPRKPHLNERESYSILKDDWETLVDDYRMQDLQRLMK
ncbi:hypothetical protein LTR16_003345 [Cryomyces antarcticus]|uniref:Glycoside hydrolase family 5 domain-containing protein n=1 Tax=Cryomyces antarcticus TaxID=329879 RepID=A0ABR0LP08_9PEZI|nr:hypothetical protein LTR39_002576 [Cryomyces antarcticus]KAK5016125.1 hypothetical protein LTR60_002553 [Cryomyces antarcticus]KAK5201247.1 hypothetical protein LTR16_003345 [Cryomyces antarcticus]